jgi:small subunit ribosomal protein S18
MSAADTPTVKRPFFKRKKTCPFTGPKAPEIDWKDVRLLGRYISERGKIVPSRITAVSTSMALLPHVRSEWDSSR